jgi:hypothetical protein
VCPKITEVLPLLYPHGQPSRDFVTALERFLGSGADYVPRNRRTALLAAQVVNTVRRPLRSQPRLATVIFRD